MSVMLNINHSSKQTNCKFPLLWVLNINHSSKQTSCKFPGELLQNPWRLIRILKYFGTEIKQIYICILYIQYQTTSKYCIFRWNYTCIDIGTHLVNKNNQKTGHRVWQIIVQSDSADEDFYIDTVALLISEKASSDIGGELYTLF